MLCLSCLKSLISLWPTSCVTYSADLFVFLLSAGSFSTTALPRHLSSWNGNSTCQRWVCSSQVCHLHKYLAFPWDRCLQRLSLKVMFSFVFLCSSISSSSYPLSTNGRLSCLSPVAPRWLSLGQHASPSCLPLLHAHSSWVRSLLS